jgi:class 3 adenylate cyclase
VLFADMKGSPSSPSTAPGRAAHARSGAGRDDEAVHRYEGTVNQVLGDGVMAIFGAPVAHEDHAVRAAYAALRMHEEVHRLARDLRRAEGVDVQIRVGLNSGEVVVRAIGSDLHMDYSAVGQTTHRRLRSAPARPGLTLLAPETRGYRGVLAVTAFDRTDQGATGPVEVHDDRRPALACRRRRCGASRAGRRRGRAAS